MRAIQRTRAAWGDLVVGLVVLAAAVILAAFPFLRSGQAITVQVTVDGEEIYAEELERLNEPLLLAVEGSYPLVLELSRDGVRVTETQCPGEDCLHMGVITRAGEQIVCLPNRMVVLLQGEEAAYDAITG